MNSQEPRSLQEAYLNVYQELDEAVMGVDSEDRKAAADERKKKKRLPPSRGRENVAKMQRDIKFYDKLTKTEEVNTYNTLLSHLLDEGYASTEENADKIILNMSEAWFEDIMELNRYAKEKGKDPRSGRPSVKGGIPEMNPDHPKNPKDGRTYGGSKQKPKVPGEKPPVAGEPDSGRQTPAHKVALRRAHAERMRNQPIGSRYD